MTRLKIYIYPDWLMEMKGLGGGWTGAIVILASLLAAGWGAINGLEYFPAGSYPRIILALPGLIVGAVVFLLLSIVLWPLRKLEWERRERENEQGGGTT